MTREHAEFREYERPEESDPDVAFRRNVPDFVANIAPPTAAEELAAALASALPPPGIPWEPIASAPPDNTVVWLYALGEAFKGNRLHPNYGSATHWAPSGESVTL